MANLSRPKRWAAAVLAAQEAVGEIEAAKAVLAEKLQGLEEIRQEYEEWRDNFPENAQGSATYEKLNEVADLDGLTEEDDLETMLEAVESAANIELPLGYGRD